MGDGECCPTITYTLYGVGPGSQQSTHDKHSRVSGLEMGIERYRLCPIKLVSADAPDTRIFGKKPGHDTIIDLDMTHCVLQELKLDCLA